MATGLAVTFPFTRRAVLHTIVDMFRHLVPVLSLLALCGGLLAQDKITLANGDVLTGKIKTMADGKVTIESPLLGEVVVPLTNISDLTTQDQVQLKTKGGDLLRRRIVGLEGSEMRLEGDTNSLMLENLGMINPPEKPEPAWTGSVKLTGLFATGNTERRAAGLLFDASRRSEIDRFTVDATWDYSENKGVDPSNTATFRQWDLNQRRAGGGLKYDYFLSQRWYSLVTARVLGDTLADIKLRFTSGVGLGYTVLEDKTTLLQVEAGISYFNENYRSATPSQDYLAARVAYRLQHQLSDDTRLVHRVEAYPSLESSDDIYLQSVTELSTSLTSNMIAAISHILDYDNTPAPGRDRSDHRVLLSVGWAF
jgi:putative salt-induced outer membrane protein YdiY